MPTASFAVQPADWFNFDPVGCTWATDINNAYNIAHALNVKCVIWRVPHSGQPMRWITVTEDHFQTSN